MRALLLKYFVMMQAGPEKAIQPRIQQGIVWFRENRKAASQNKWKKGKEEQSVTYGIVLDRKMFGSCDMMYNVTCSDTDTWSNAVVFFSLDKPENVKLMVNYSVVCKGDVISITCSADGKPAVYTYQLFESEIPVNDGKSSAGVWIRKDLKGGDLSYRCVANNTVGTTEKTVNVTVKGTVWKVVVTTISLHMVNECWWRVRCFNTIFPVVFCIAYLTSSGNDTWVFLSVRLHLILFMSSTVSCSLHHNSLIQLSLRCKSKNSTPVHFGWKQSQHFAVLSYEGLHVSALLKQSCFSNR